MAEENPDIRERVEEDRGPLKKFELLVPGFRGYRKVEDLRVSDELLRNQIADKLNRARGNLEDLRQKIVAAGDYTSLALLGSLISKVQQFSGEVRHAEQGYSGFGPAISINENRLNKLYDYDYAFILSAIQLQEITSSSTLIYDTTAPASIQTGLEKVNVALSDFKKKWLDRMEAIEGILVK